MCPRVLRMETVMMQSIFSWLPNMYSICIFIVEMKGHTVTLYPSGYIYTKRKGQHGILNISGLFLWSKKYKYTKYIKISLYPYHKKVCFCFLKVTFPLTLN